MKRTTLTNKKNIKFKKCYEIDVIYHITQFNSKIKKHNDSIFWIAHFSNGNGYLNYEVYCDSKLIHSNYGFDYKDDPECYSEDSDSPDIYDDSLSWFSQEIGQIIDFEATIEIDNFLSSLNIKALYGIKNPKVIYEYSSDEVNTKNFTFFELKYKSYGKLINFINGLIELVEDYEYTIETMLELEKKDELPKELEKELNKQITQLDYLFKNIQTGIEAMKYHEDKIKFKYNEFDIFIN
jgi:hypothetical protein